MRILLLATFSILTIYASGQTFTRYMPIPPTPQQSIMGSCAPIIQTSDGGYVLNYSYGYPNWDVAGPIFSEIVKTDSLFIPLWRKELTGENGKKTFSFPDGTSIIYTKGGGVGIEKIDNSGQTLWLKKYSRTYPYSLLVNDAIYQNATIKFAGCVMKYNGFGNWDYSSSLLLSIDTAGNFVQADSLVISSFANTSIDNIINDSSGNYYIMGSGFGSSGNSFVAKITSSNTVAWCNKMYSSGYTPSYTSSSILSNGDLLIGGVLYNSIAATGAIILLRFSSTGNLIWSKTIDYPSSVGSVQEIANGNIIVTGAHRAAYGDTLKNIIFKIDANGNPIWTKRYNEGFSLGPAYQKSSNDWYFTAFTTEPVLFNTDSSGVTNCQYSNFNLTINNLSVTVTPITCVLNSLTISSTTMATNPISSQAYLDTCFNISTSISEIDISDKLKVYPNPTSGLVNILFDNIIDDILVTNIFGQVVYQSKPNNSKFTFNLDGTGIYFIIITSDKQKTMKKIAITQ
jgi:hypothetical protein